MAFVSVVVFAFAFAFVFVFVFVFVLVMTDWWCYLLACFDQAGCNDKLEDAEEDEEDAGHHPHVQLGHVGHPGNVGLLWCCKKLIMYTLLQISRHFQMETTSSIWQMRAIVG